MNVCLILKQKTDKNQTTNQISQNGRKFLKKHELKDKAKGLSVSRIKYVQQQNKEILF